MSVSGFKEPYAITCRDKLIGDSANGIARRVPIRFHMCLIALKYLCNVKYRSDVKYQSMKYKDSPYLTTIG